MDKTYATLYDQRKDYGQGTTDLGYVRLLNLTKLGGLRLETDLAFKLTISFSKNDLHRLFYRLMEIRKIELEQIAKRRAKVKAKAEQKSTE